MRPEERSFQLNTRLQQLLAEAHDGREPDDPMFGVPPVGARRATHAAEVLSQEIPISAYEAAPLLLDRERLVFLDSSLSSSSSGRYSFVTADPFLVIRSHGRRVELKGCNGTAMLDADPLEVVQLLLNHYQLDPVAGLPPFLGGAIGYFGYELAHVLERQSLVIGDDNGLPDLDLGFYDWVLASDHVTNKNWLIETNFSSFEESDVHTRRAEIRKRLTHSTTVSHPDATPIPHRLRSNVSRADYLESVRRAKAYIAAGDIYQVNLSHRLEGQWKGPTWPLYERLRACSPVPYGAYLSLGHDTILSASPERFLRLNAEDKQVETRPIKGTRPRGGTPAEDHDLAAELLSSEKDRAENLMIVDLLRNDLGKVCRVGTVRVPELYGVERYATVLQLVSTITGQLRSDVDATGLLRACFPGGSITGCPKIRAMEIIEELEHVRRGVYCGAIGYLSFTGAMDTNIAIRTLEISGDQVYCHVGGAIVADSIPEEEYAETMVKARACLHALPAEMEEW